MLKKWKKAIGGTEIGVKKSEQSGKDYVGMETASRLTRGHFTFAGGGVASACRFFPVQGAHIDGILDYGNPKRRDLISSFFGFLQHTWILDE